MRRVLKYLAITPKNLIVYVKKEWECLMNEVEAITWRTVTVAIFPVASCSLVEMNPGGEESTMTMDVAGPCETPAHF